MEWELHGGIIEATIEVALPMGAIVEPGHLRRYAAVKEEGQRVQAGLRRGVHRIDLACGAEAVSDAAHRSPGRKGAVGLHAISETCIRGVCAVLCHHRQGATKEDAKEEGED